MDRFGLRSLDCFAAFSGVETVEGTVAVIPNDVVALVDVVLESVVIKVLLFRSSLIQRCERIQDAVVVGDSLCLQLSYGYIFCGCKQWYAEKAFKTSEVINVNNHETLLCQQVARMKTKVTPNAPATCEPSAPCEPSATTHTEK